MPRDEQPPVPQFQTIIPLHNLSLEADALWQFADGFVLGALPAWVRTESMLNDLNRWDREGIEEAGHAFIATYAAASLGEPDPAWQGPTPKSIQETKYEIGVLGNLALWLSRPGSVCFTIVLHAPVFSSGPVAQRITSHSPLLCHPGHERRRITADDLRVAATLHESLVLVERDTALWTAIRATWAGLQMNIEAIRYVLFWVALEALFGPDDGREITYRLSQRVGFFLGQDRAEARQLFDTAKKGYGLRSKIVHGRWSDNAESETRMLDTEGLVQRSLVKILDNTELRQTFSQSAKGREHFLDALAFEARS